MNILLTGSNGFFGKIILSHLSNSNVLWGLSRIGSDYNCYLEKQVPKFNLQFDLVIHAAGKAHSFSNKRKDSNDFYLVNVVGTQNLLEGLGKSGIPKYFVFISSVSVYGKDFGSGIDEDAPLLAMDPYGLSKIQAEKVILDWCKKHNVIYTILRLPLLVGQNPPGNLGAMINGIQKGYYFNIAGGNAKKSMVLAEDVAKSILKVAEIGGIFNLTDGYHPSFLELSNHISYQLSKGKPVNLPLWFVNMIAKLGDLLGNNSPINSNKLKKIISNLTFDDSRAREVFGWNPTPVLKGFKFN
jgi:nucleoside-diphosphate-sugar epimerase